MHCNCWKHQRYDFLNNFFFIAFNQSKKGFIYTINFLPWWTNLRSEPDFFWRSLAVLILQWTYTLLSEPSALQKTKVFMHSFIFFWSNEISVEGGLTTGTCSVEHSYSNQRLTLCAAHINHVPIANPVYHCLLHSHQRGHFHHKSWMSSSFKFV